MAQPIEFYFDFSSPYSYFASARLDDLAGHYGRVVRWRPILLGAAFKVSGMQPLLEIPLKNEYARRDIARFARLLDLRFRLPEKFPFAAVAASRAFYWLDAQDGAWPKRSSARSTGRGPTSAMSILCAILQAAWACRATR